MLLSFSLFVTWSAKLSKNSKRCNPLISWNEVAWSSKKDFGLIAHELQEIYPFLVSGEKDGETHQSVNYIGLIALLIKEIQELKSRVKILE